MPSLTSHLIALDPIALKTATNHPFLAAAATQNLPLDKLKQWLAQDRLYQMAYLSFIGKMLSMIGIPSGPDRETTLEWRAADLLIDCLTNIRREMQLFEDAARAEGWYDDLCGTADDPPQPSLQTRAYQDLFAGATAQGRPLIVGLTLLWATEECYLRSWRYAWTRMDLATPSKERDVMQRTFIPNWSSAEFEAFVRRIGGLVNRFGGFYEEGGWEWRECEIVWRQVVWCEREFWPKVEAE